MLSRIATLFNGAPPGARAAAGADTGLGRAAVGAPGHRSEIDGLRAIAVLAVVFYHFSVPGFGGGFVGVDIFFVISGFLIGDILWRELSGRGTISLLHFYGRRIRRLAPAYAVMAVVTFIAAYAILLPFEFREFGKELIAATFYFSNIYFYKKAGYFDTAAEDKVFLHTWSLSVEEQFYIFLPALMLLFRRGPRMLVWTLVAIFVLSLVSSVIVTRTSHTAAFFLFPFRAWELLAGVLLAIWGQQQAEQWRHHQALSWAGIALLIGGIVFIQPGAAFPGVQAVVPALGAVLIILNGRQDNAVNRALSLPVMVFVGLISYSLYLWHWPVVTLSRYYRDGAGGALETALWMGLAFGLAWLSWRFVEQPVRRATWLRSPMLLAGAAAASVCLFAVGALPYLRNGMPERYPPEIRAHIEASADFLQDWSRCNTPANGPLAGIEVCPIGPEGPPSFLVWGDSHVRAFKEGLALLAQEQGRSGLVIWRAGCPPLFDIAKTESAATRQQDEDCTAHNARIRQVIPQLAGIERLLIIGRWSYYAEGIGIGRDKHNTIALASTAPGAPSQADKHAVFANAVEATMTELSRSFRQVIVLRQVPEIPFYDSREVSRRLAHHRLTPEDAEKSVFTVPLQQVAARQAASEAPFRKLAAAGVITWLDSWPTFCSGDACSAMRDGRALFFDNNHVVNLTALTMRHLFDPLMGRAGADIAQPGVRQ
jgi:peptidoglycan/LPS O-acetylase OafA/YrhL